MLPFPGLEPEKSERRSLCENCHRAQKACWCSYLPKTRIPLTGCRVVLLQHPNEEKKRKIRTGKMVELSLDSKGLLIRKGRRFPGSDEDLRKILEGPRVYLLYPGEKGKTLKIEDVRPSEGPTTFIFLDGTWDEARKLYARSPALHVLPRIQLNGLSEYVVRTQPSEKSLSTLESVAYVLSAFYNDSCIYESLIKPLRAMCETQLHFGALHHDSKEIMKVAEYDINLIWAILSFYSIYMIFFGIYVVYFESRLPSIFIDSFKFGKTIGGGKKKTNPLVRCIQIPKSYFSHFYLFASVYGALHFYLCFVVYLEPISAGREKGAPSWLVSTLNFIGGEERKSSTDPESIFLVMALLIAQIIRRLYECTRVNVDTGSKMNVLHYIVGFTHYFCACTGVLLEAPGFVPSISLYHYDENLSAKITWINVHLNIYRFGLKHVLGTVIFFVAWSSQFSVHKTFASLKRKQISSNDGSAYSIPEGRGFKYVSCPHYLSEIIMYICIAGILGFKHKTMNVVAVWVLVNQVISALMSQQWYKNTFPHYPKNRKAIFPFIL